MNKTDAPNPIHKPIRKPKSAKAKKPSRTILEKQIEAIAKLIVFWRDGSECIERHIDGRRCGGGIQYGHYIPRAQSSWMKWNLGNTHAQCRNHNNLHDKGAQTMSAWFGNVLGNDVQKAFEKEVSEAIQGKWKYKIYELEAMLKEYDELYQNRYYVDAGNLNELVEKGYYGNIIQRVFRERISNE